MIRWIRVGLIIFCIVFLSDFKCMPIHYTCPIPFKVVNSFYRKTREIAQFYRVCSYNSLLIVQTTEIQVSMSRQTCIALLIWKVE